MYYTLHYKPDKKLASFRDRFTNQGRMDNVFIFMVNERPQQLSFIAIVAIRAGYEIDLDRYLKRNLDACLFPFTHDHIDQSQFSYNEIDKETFIHKLKWSIDFHPDLQDILDMSNNFNLTLNEFSSTSIDWEKDQNKYTDSIHKSIEEANLDSNRFLVSIGHKHNESIILSHLIDCLINNHLALSIDYVLVNHDDLDLLKMDQRFLNTLCGRTLVIRYGHDDIGKLAQMDENRMRLIHSLSMDIPVILLVNQKLSKRYLSVINDHLKAVIFTDSEV